MIEIYQVIYYLDSKREDTKQLGKRNYVSKKCSIKIEKRDLQKFKDKLKYVTGISKIDFYYKFK